MAARNKRSLGIDYSVLTTESDKLKFSPCSLEAASSILHLALDNPNLKFRGLASSPDFVPILHYCAISVRRFIIDIEEDISSLLKLAKKAEVPPLAEELFIIEIYIIHGLEFSEENAQHILEIYPTFEKDLEICRVKTENVGYLQNAEIKQREEKVPYSDDELIAIYAKSEVEFWCILVEFQCYNVIESLIQEVRTNRKLSFPTQFLLANFRGSPAAMHIIKEYIKAQYDNFLDDSRWVPFVEETPEILDVIITDLGINASKLNKNPVLIAPFLQELFWLVQSGKTDIVKLIHYIILIGDEIFLSILEKKPVIADQFRHLFLTYFEKLHNDKKWCKFIEESKLMLNYIGLNLYPSIPNQTKIDIPGLNFIILGNFMEDNNVEHIINFMTSLSTSFFVEVLESEQDIEMQFKNLFIMNFDSYIVNKKFRDFVRSSDLLLNMIVTDIIPKSETKQKDICQDLYEEYLTRELNSGHNIVLSDFVVLLSSPQTKEFLNFEALRPSLQVALFQSVARKLTAQDLAANKKIYTQFFSSFLKSHALLLLIPQELRRPFYLTVVVPYISNTISLTVQQMYDLVTSIVDDPFADQERPDFFFFIVEHAEQLLPQIKQNPKFMNTLWNFLTTTQLDLRANDSKNFIFNICIIKLRSELPDDHKLYQMTYQNFSVEVFEKMDQTEKTEVIFNIAAAFNRPLEALIEDAGNRQAYIDAAQSALDLFAQDKNFVPTIALVMNRENREFIKLLINVFSKERPFLELFAKPDIFMNFVTIGLDLFPVLVKGLVITNDRFEQMFLFLQKYAYEISLNDTLRHALLNYFISNDAKLNRFLPTVTAPAFRAFFFTDFTDPARNSILTQVFNIYLNKARSCETPCSGLFNVYVTICNLPFINVKNHDDVANDCINYFLYNKNEYEFDAMYPRQRQLDIEHALYTMCVNLGPEKFIDFLKCFDNIPAGPSNCFREATENALLLYNDSHEEEPKDSVVEYERQHPRFRRFVQKPDRFNDFVHGIIGAAIMVYLAILAYSNVKQATGVCAFIGGITAFIICFCPIYFPVLAKPGYTAWFWITLVLVLFNFAFSMTTFCLTETYHYNVPLVILVVLFALVSMHRVIYKLQGIPEEEYDEGDLLIIN